MKGPQKILVKSKDWVITVDEFKERIEQDLSLVKGKDAEFLRDRKREILEEIIDEKILFEESKRFGITYGEKEEEEFIRQLKEQYGEEFERHFPAQSERLNRLKLLARKRVILEKTVEKLSEGVVPTEEEIMRYYENNKSEFIRPERVRLWQIVVMDKQRAIRIWKMLKKGGDFSTLARQYSVGPEGKEGGFMGVFTKGELPKELDDVAFKIPPGKISDVIRSPYGFHILYVEKREKSEIIPFEEARDKIKKRLTDEKREVFVSNWIREKRNGLQIRVMEKEWEKLLEDS